MKVKIITLLLLLQCFLSESQIDTIEKTINFSATIEKFEDPFERIYFPIWTSRLLLRVKSDKYFELSAWGDPQDKSFIYVNITYIFNNIWISINPLYSDIYNPTIQVGFIMLVFHPPRN